MRTFSNVSGYLSNVDEKRELRKTSISVHDMTWPFFMRPGGVGTTH